MQGHPGGNSTGVGSIVQYPASHCNYQAAKLMWPITHCHFNYADNLVLITFYSCVCHSVNIFWSNQRFPTYSV